MARLVVTIYGADPSDLDWLKPRVDGAVDELVEEMIDENRNDAEIYLEDSTINYDESVQRNVESD